MTTRGSVDHRVIGGGTGNGTRGPINEVFTGLFNFLTSSYAQAAGVTLVAYNTGSQGSGMGYWDSSTPSGENAWACFKFANATVPFYTFIQYNNLDTSSGITGASFGAGGGSPGAIFGGSYTSGIGIQFAMDDNGGAVWNGSTNKNGHDSKGSPVWAATNATSGNLFVFPRSNSSGGNYATNHENCFGLVYNLISNASSVKYSGARFHILIDENNFMFLHDISYDGSYQMCYFGKYEYRPDITSSLPSYVMIGYKTETNNPIPDYGTSVVYGSTAGTTTTQDGGIILPLASAQVSNGSPGVKGASIDMVPNIFFDARFHPNGGFDPAKYDTFPVFLAMNESPLFGFVGKITFFNMCFGLPSHATDSTQSRAVFGNGNQASGKMLVPWDGSSTPGQGANRTGRQF